MIELENDKFSQSYGAFQLLKLVPSSALPRRADTSTGRDCPAATLYVDKVQIPFHAIRKRLLQCAVREIGGAGS